MATQLKALWSIVKQPFLPPPAEPVESLLDGQPVWILGNYHRGQQDPDLDEDTQKAILDDLGSLHYFSYRKDFAAIDPAGLTSDSGWGCMLRTAQMMLAHVLVRVHGAEAGWCRQLSSDVADLVADWFADRPDAPYSIHSIAKEGASCGVEVRPLRFLA